MRDLDVANAMADAAQNVTLALFRAPELLTSNKEASGFDPVTQADRDAETAMRAVLAELRPDDGIWGEEHGQQDGISGRRWVLDPIDGTRGFISGLPLWGTLIGLEDQVASKVLLGMVDQPYIGERFVGCEGSAVLMRGGESRELRVKGTKNLKDAILFTTFPEVGTAQDQAAFNRVSAKVLLTRYGTDCYAYALLAAGQIDLVIEAGLNAYDIMGPVGLIEAAGGVVTNWEGGPVHLGGRALAASSAELHAQALELIAKS